MEPELERQICELDTLLLSATSEILSHPFSTRDFPELGRSATTPLIVAKSVAKITVRSELIALEKYVLFIFNLRLVFRLVPNNSQTASAND